MGATALLAHEGGGPGYRVTLVAAEPGPVRADSGLQLVADAQLPESGAIDTLLVPGGTRMHGLAHDDPFIGWLRRAANRSARVVSVCTGAFALAAAGILDGCSATTHWRYAEALAREHPYLDVQADAIYLRQGRVWTAASRRSEPVRRPRMVAARSEAVHSGGPGPHPR